MKKILGLTLVFVMLVTALAVLPAAATDEDGYYAYLDQGITLVHRHGGEEYPVSVAAKEIGETKQFTCGCTNSVEDYLLGLADSADSSAATKAISLALLNYGAAAKAYFGYTGADIFGTPVTDTTALKAAKAPEASVEGNEDGIYLGATLVLDGTMKLRFFFASSDVKVNYEDNEQSAFEREGYDYGFFDVPVMPYAMEDYVTLSVTTEAGTTTVKYAPINYLQNMADNAELSEMVASIYAYGEAAFDYYYEGSYVYPMDGIVLANGTISHNTTTGGSANAHKFVAGGGEKIALIDLTEIDYDTVTVNPNLNGEAGFVTFLTTEPTTHGNIVNYALNYNDMLQFNEPVTLVIPENAKYMAVTNNYDSGTSCLPKSIVFSDTVTPADNLKDDSLETYEYPMETIKNSQGTIASASQAFESNFDWVSAIVSIEGTVFNQVEIEIGENGWVGYCFLTQYPTLNKVVSYAGKNVTSKYSIYGEPGEKIIADIPKNAVCMVINTYEPEGGVPVSYLPAAMTFTKNGTDIDPLEDLQDETLSKYEYPMDYVIGADGAIIYWGDGENKDKYLTEADGKAAGYYKNAFIDITDTAFDRVTIIPNSKQPAGWAFLTEMPEVGEVAQYVGYQGFLWSDSVSSVDIIIPEDANYLVVYYEENNASYIPASITFEQSTYSYPMDQLTPVDAEFTRQNDKYKKHAYYTVTTTGENVAFIDLANLDYNTVTLVCHAVDSGWYTFVTKRPINNGEKISYAMNNSGANWFNPGDTVTVTIPDNAAYMVVLYNYNNKKPTYPQSIVFSNSDTTPSEMLKNDTLDSYEYPMDAIKPSMGTIANDGNKFIQSYEWVGSYVGIEDCVFDKVTFEIGESGKMYYAFLTAYPTLDQAVSFAGGATKVTELTGAVGDKISVSIPDDAVCLYIYRHDWENSAPAYCLPASVTFRKATTLEKLQDPIRDEFSYPMDEVVSAGGCVIYWDKDGNDITNGDHLFLENAYNEGVGKYQCAFIEITDTVFNYVSFRNNNVKTTGWAFLSNRPGEGEAAQYVGYKGFRWSGSTNPFNVEIPEGANYLAIWYIDSGNNYVPESITFSKNPIDPVRFLQDSSSEYQYPMGAFTPTSTIVHYNTLVYGTFAPEDMKNEDWKVVIIDITDTTFTQIQLTTKKSAKQWIGWTFLKEAPVEGDKVSVVDGYPETGWKSVSNSRGTTIDIPEGAKYFVYWYQDTATSQYLLDAVKFIKKD